MLRGDWFAADSQRSAAACTADYVLYTTICKPAPLRLPAADAGHAPPRQAEPPTEILRPSDKCEFTLISHTSMNCCLPKCKQSDDEVGKSNHEIVVDAKSCLVIVQSGTWVTKGFLE